MSVAYEEDFVEWAHDSAELLRAGQLGSLDLDHLAEEVEDLGKRHRLQAESRLGVLLMHLAKWQMQPEWRESSSWRSAIVVQRFDTKRLLTKFPSLRWHLVQELQSLYADALRSALSETRLVSHSLPEECPFTLQQILDDSFFPG